MQRDSSIDEKYQRYVTNKTILGKADCDVLFWLTVSILGYVFYFALNDIAPKFIECKSPKLEAMMQLLNDISLQGNDVFPEDYNFFDNFPKYFCMWKMWAFTWFVLILLRIPFLMFIKRGLFLKFWGLQLHKRNGESWTPVDYMLYGFIEWLPMLLGAAYILIIGIPVGLFNAIVFKTVTLLAQAIWLAPFIFRKDNKNIVEILTGISAEPTKKKQEKLKKKYEKKISKFFFGFDYRASYIVYTLFVAFYLFLFVQILRVPPQNPNYQPMVYGGYEPVWENNIYFAMRGLSAPEDVEDFYQYGRKKAFDNFVTFRTMKKLLGVDEQYLYEIPELDNLSSVLTEDEEIEIGQGATKKLRCLYKLEKTEDETEKECATFEDLSKFISENKIIWKRFNHAPDMGSVYVTPPMLVGGQMRSPLQLVQLKAASIIDIAKNGAPDQAMKEWLRYMKLYRMMAADRGPMVYKAVMGVSIGIQRQTLEKLLYMAPELATTYEAEITAALKNDGPIFNDSLILADDWGLVEPFMHGTMGNANAVKILSQNLPNSEISAYVKAAPDNLQNPITNTPFEWDEETAALSFKSPVTETRHSFKLNIQ